jgi:glutamyl endopeptidase
MGDFMQFARLSARSLMLIGASAALVFASWPAAAEVIDPDATVSSEGSVTPSVPNAAASTSISPSFEGLDRGGQGALSAGAMSGYGARPATEEDLRNFRNAKPRRGPAGGPQTESVIGTDSRVRIANTRTYPARATVQILFKETPSGGFFLCSGWLVNKNTVVTAGHCVAPGDGSALFPKSTYVIAPGKNGNTAPYGVCGAKALYTNATWKASANDQYDYAAIKLDCNVGTTTGWYGYSKLVALNNPITIEGYPGDKPSGTQWKMAGKVTVLQARRVFYKIDTFGGQSGSPVWRKIGTTCPVCGIAIHAYGVYGSGVTLNNNHGTRITTPVFQNITTWKNKP